MRTNNPSCPQSRWRFQQLRRKVSNRTRSAHSCIDRTFVLGTADTQITPIAFNRSAQLLAFSSELEIQLISALTGAILHTFPRFLDENTPLGPGEFLFGASVVIFKRSIGPGAGIYVVETNRFFGEHSFEQSCHKILSGVSFSLFWVTGAEDTFAVVPHGTSIVLPYCIRSCVKRGRPWVMDTPLIADTTGRVTRDNEPWLSSICEYTTGCDLVHILGAPSTDTSEEQLRHIESGLHDAIFRFKRTYGAVTCFVCERVMFVFRKAMHDNYTHVDVFRTSRTGSTHVCSQDIQCTIQMKQVQVIPFLPCPVTGALRAVILAPTSAPCSGVLYYFNDTGHTASFSKPVFVSEMPAIAVLSADNIILTERFAIYLQN